MVKLKLFPRKTPNKDSNYICVYRGCGGYGDIINMRLIFEDIKKHFKNNLIDWCLPYSFFDAAKLHPFVDNLIALQDYNIEKYKFIIDLTTACTRYEWKHKQNTFKNRAEIWSSAANVSLNNPQTYMPSYDECIDNIQKDLFEMGYRKNKKLIIFCPFSSLESKNLTKEQILYIKELTKNHFLVCLHNKKIKFIDDNKILSISNYSLKQSMALTKIADYVISTDTGHLHCSGAYNIPTLGLFCYTNGKIITKYYKSVEVVQIDDMDCGPCYTYTSCCKSNELVKPCRINISLEQIKKSWQKLLN